MNWEELKQIMVALMTEEDIKELEVTFHRDGSVEMWSMYNGSLGNTLPHPELELPARIQAYLNKKRSGIEITERPEAIVELAVKFGYIQKHESNPNWLAPTELGAEIAHHDWDENEITCAMSRWNSTDIVNVLLHKIQEQALSGCLTDY